MKSLNNEASAEELAKLKANPKVKAIMKANCRAAIRQCMAQLQDALESEALGLRGFTSL